MVANRCLLRVGHGSLPHWGKSASPPKPSLCRLRPRASASDKLEMGSGERKYKIRLRPDHKQIRLGAVVNCSMSDRVTLFDFEPMPVFRVRPSFVLAISRDGRSLGTLESVPDDRTLAWWFPPTKPRLFSQPASGALPAHKAVTARTTAPSSWGTGSITAVEPGAGGAELENLR